MALNPLTTFHIVAVQQLPAHQSSRLRAAATKAVLMAKQKLLEQKHSVELEQRLKPRAEQLEL